MQKIIGQLKEFRLHWKNYIFQSLIAAAAVFIALFLFNVEKRPIMIASIGATAFIIFAMPNSITANTTNVLGGYISGIIIGSLCFLAPHSTYLGSICIYSIAVGISIFLMVIIDVEHPPASGIALSFAMNGFSLKSSLSLVLCVIVMLLFHSFFKRHLKDLT